MVRGYLTVFGRESAGRYIEVFVERGRDFEI